MGIFIGILEEGLIYAILALGVLITYRILDFPDLTVDSSFPLGAAVSAILTVNGMHPRAHAPDGHARRRGGGAGHGTDPCQAACATCSAASSP